MANMNKNNTNRGGLEANPSPWDITAEDLQKIDNGGEDEKEKTALERLEESNLDPSILNSNALKDALRHEDINIFEVSADGKRLNFRGMVQEDAQYGEMRYDNHPTGIDVEDVYGKGKMISRHRMVSDYSIVKRDDGGIHVIQTRRSNVNNMTYHESNNTLDIERVYHIGKDQKTYDKNGMVVDSEEESHEPYRIKSTKRYNGTGRHYSQDFHDLVTDSRFAGQRMNDNGGLSDHFWAEAQYAPVTRVVEMHRNENDKDLVTIQQLRKGVWSTAVNLPVDSRDDYELNPSGRGLMIHEDSFKENKDNKWVDVKDVADR